MAKLLGEYRFNAYIKFYQLVYFDITFFSIMKYADSENDETDLDNKLTVLAIIGIVTSIAIPLFINYVVHSRFHLLKINEMRKSFSVLLSKIDKSERNHTYTVLFFFFRRFMTSVIYAINPDSKIYTLMYNFIAFMSNLYLSWLMGMRPY